MAVFKFDNSAHPKMDAAGLKNALNADLRLI